MSDDRRDDVPEHHRADVYSSARIGAAAALTLVLVVLLVLDVAVPDYDISPGFGYTSSAGCLTEEHVIFAVLTNWRTGHGPDLATRLVKAALSN